MVSQSHTEGEIYTTLTDPYLFQQQFQPTPSINADYWSLMLGGAVDIPLMLSYTDLLALPQVTLDCAIACIGNPPGGQQIGQAWWQGVAVKSLLAEVTVQPDVRYSHLYAADGYSTCVSFAHFENAVLVYSMNGNTLPAEYGYPVRMIVPGLYGYKMPKWVQRIILAETPAPGLWEQRGWSGSGEVQTLSQIRSPLNEAKLQGPTTLSGIAYAGNRAITSIEISVDGSPWMPAQFTQDSPAALAQWSIEWESHAPGAHLITVRATDETGFTQSPPADAHPFPNGSSGLHSIIVHT